MTVPASMFKYILNKYLEKYKYSRPEYLKDFYIASDLVRKAIIFDNIRGKEKHNRVAGGYFRHRKEYSSIASGQ